MAERTDLCLTRMCHKETRMPQARTVRAVIFDLDGTLVDSMRAAPQAYADTIRARGGPPSG